MIPLEDDFEDIISKAMNGRGWSVPELATRAAVPVEAINHILNGDISDLPAFESIAHQLALDFESLRALHQGDKAPLINLPDGLFHFNAPFPVSGYEEMCVNHYLFCPYGGSVCFAVDTGPSASPVVGKLAASSSRLKQLFLTHTHPDHIAALSEYQKICPAVYAPEREELSHCMNIKPGDHFDFGQYSIHALSTTGHSRGGTSYLLEGLEQSVVFVGDAIFCRSMGKAPGLLANALTEVRNNILSLPPATIICPGHGPITTVAFELENNPFFAQTKASSH